MSMITIRNLQFQYDAAPETNALYGIDLEIRKGECVILTGESGCGKTTLTRCLNGLIPNFFEGTLTGEILYEGVPVNKLEQYELSRKIGTVFQDPRSQFFAVNTTDEVAFGCENLAFSTERINQNVDAAFSRMNIDVLRDRSLFGLSSGEKQRLAVASIYDLNFHFTWGEEGRIIGIVGANGSGKTTFSKVLCGLMAPRTGEIRLNGKKMTHRELLKKTYFVMQDADYQLFTESVAHEMELAARKKSKKTFDLQKRKQQTFLTDSAWPNIPKDTRYPCPADKSSGSRLLRPSLQNRIFLFWTSRRVGLTDGICSV